MHLIRHAQEVGPRVVLIDFVVLKLSNCWCPFLSSEWLSLVAEGGWSEVAESNSRKTCEHAKVIFRQRRQQVATAL